jgi:DNA invertase Pin-like site-specific DNA recombinase
MKYGYARVSTDGQSVDAQVRQLTKAAGDVLTVTRLDRLARSTRDLLNTLAAITAKKAGFRSLGYSAHSMRATFITTALENGAQLEDVQKAAEAV